MIRLPVLLTALLVPVACAASSSSPASPARAPIYRLPPGETLMKFGGVEVTFSGKKTRTLPLELALTDAQQSRGLMWRSFMPRDAGMLFLNSQPASGGFWMKNTLIPLDIAFFDASGRINDILQMQPCKADPCPVYTPGKAYVGAIEMNLGWYKRAGIVVGDRVSYKVLLGSL